jgi:capsular exopolysaccharide synthesis family protein
MRKYELDLFDYWRIICKRRWIIIFTFVATIASTFVYFETKPKEYEATSLIRVEKRFTVAELLLGTIIPAPAATDSLMVTSYEVIKEAVKELGLVREDASEYEIDKMVRFVQSSVEAEVVPNTDNYISITAVSRDPQMAADIANIVAETFIKIDTQEKSKDARLVRQYIETQLELTKKKLEETEKALVDLISGSKEAIDSEVIFKRLNDMQIKLAELLDKFTERHPKVITLLDKIKSQKEKLEEISDVDLMTKQLKRDIDVHRKLYAMLREELEKASITEAGKVTAAIIVDRARVPNRPAGPERLLALFTGGICGLLIGLILAFTREQLDTSIATIDDVEEYIKLPVLGIIPHARIDEFEEGAKAWEKISARSKSDKERNRLIRLISLYRPKSPETESYRSLRTNIQFSVAKDKSKILMFTSAGPQEGKTTVIVNLAITFAQAGNNVLLIGCNLRRPTIYRTFDIVKTPGLSDVLIERMNWRETIRSLPDFLRSSRNREIIEKSPELDNLKIITSGETPPNPTELISSSEMDKLLREVREEFDIILIDCPPILPVADSGILASKVDRVVIIYKVGKTARSALSRAKVRLENLGAKLCGVVLNDITTDIDIAGATYYYHYKYYGEGKPRFKPRFRLKNRLRKYKAMLLALKRQLTKIQR